MIKIIDGHIYKEIDVKVNKDYVMLMDDFRIRSSELILAVEERMNHCLKQLEENISNNTIVNINVTDNKVTCYIYSNGEGFCVSSYESMESLLRKLKINDKPYYTFKSLQEFEANELNQLFKAFVQYKSEWNKQIGLLYNAFLAELINSWKNNK